MPPQPPEPMRLPNRMPGRESALAAVIVVMVAALGLRWPQFATLSSLRDVLDDTAILILLALGQMLVIVTRCIDLSVAANVALSGMIVAQLEQSHPSLPILVLMIFGMLAGSVFGAVNGLLVWLVRVPSIVATLGTMAMFRGIVYLISAGRWINSDQLSPQFQQEIRDTWLGLSMLSWLAIAGVTSIALLLRYTDAGRRLYLAGSNPAAAAYVGVQVGRSQFNAFVLCGMLAGLCGYLWVARFAVAYTDIASGFELQVIAACVIGGVSIRGGSGTVAGVLLGCVFLGIVRNALPLVGISPFWQMAVNGLVIVGAAMLNEQASAEQPRRILESVAK